MTQTVSIYDLKTQLSRLVDRAAAGEDIVIARAGKPIIRLAPIDPVGPRIPGVLKSLIVPDTLFDPLAENEAAHWE